MSLPVLPIFGMNILDSIDGRSSKMDSLVFTPAAVLDLLSKISELDGYDIGLSETIDGNLQLTVGDSVYDIKTESVEEVDVPESAVDQIEDANQAAYDSLEDDGLSVEETDQAIQSGILKEIAKTLLIGGMVRLSKKLLS